MEHVGQLVRETRCRLEKGQDLFPNRHVHLRQEERLSHDIRLSRPPLQIDNLARRINLALGGFLPLTI